jgi:hypothetical protein
LSPFTPDLRLLAEEVDPLEHLPRSRPGASQALAEPCVLTLQICQSEFQIESP